MLLQLAHETDMGVLVICAVWVYGPDVKANFFCMMRWRSKGVPLPLKALNNQRSLLTIGNLADLIVSCRDQPSAANQILLVSDGEDIFLARLLQQTGTILGKSAWLVSMSVPVMVPRVGARLAGARRRYAVLVWLIAGEQFKIAACVKLKADCKNGRRAAK